MGGPPSDGTEEVRLNEHDPTASLVPLDPVDAATTPGMGAPARGLMSTLPPPSLSVPADGAIDTPTPKPVHNVLAHALESAVAGLSAGFTAAVIFCPIDVLRIRQAVRMTSQMTAVNLAKQMWVTEGVRAFYSGLSATLLALGPNWAIYFSSYESLKRMNRQWLPEGARLHICSAVGAAVITDICTNPLWMVKTRLQTQGLRTGVPQYRGVFHAISTIAKTEGPATLWAGVTAQLLGCFHVAIQFPLYEKLKKELKGDKPALENKDTLIAASVSKTVASVIAYPHEVLRTRLQFQRKSDLMHYTNLRQACAQMWREEGFFAFYKGMSTNLVRVVPSCALTFLVYEVSTQKLREWKK